ncbi:photoreceptor cilium actin regulator [Gadus chalcogrammus]|uniref:photoreceptor cilium actin regulator n=1 Tax=Gadus chalcogrammus TaxID=1042646 RepID=UPI0024C2980B|nr:photoreceptor cilium actin regulator [Gadus chalcogrammus]
MGCSPSKGKAFGTYGSFRRGRALLPGTEDASPRDFQCVESRDLSVSADGETKERKPVNGPAQSSQREPPFSPQKRRTCLSDPPQEVVHLDISGSQATSNTPAAKGKQKSVEKDTTDKRLAKKPKKTSTGVKPVKKEKAKKVILSEQKVDFPEPLVKAHQAAYGFLNPSITKYDILLGLLEQATQTQVSVQPMAAFMLMRYEELNRGLEAMAYEGEKLLKENGEHLAWPCPTKKPSSSSPVKPASADVDPPPDLLQQLLQYTTQRMQNVCQTVGGIGDSALEEAVEYFASLSELLEEKLHIKRATDARLMQLLTRIETASLRKPGPEDSALFSEDSGIGAESESLAGSERRLRRESCESTETNRTTSSSPIGCNATTRNWRSSRRLAGKNSLSGSLTSIDSTCTIMAKELNDTESILGSFSLDYGEEDDIDGVGDADVDDRDMVVRRRANSSPIDPSQRPRRLAPKRIENPRNVEMTLKMKDAISGRIQFVPSQHAISKTKVTGSPKHNGEQWREEDEERSCKRPQTAASGRRAAVQKSQVSKQRRSQSAESLRSRGEDQTLLELERTQKVLNQRIERMSKGKAGSNTRTVPSQKNLGTSPAQSPAASRKQGPSVKNNNVQPPKEKAHLITQPCKHQETSCVDEDDEKPAVQSSKGPIKATPPPSPPSSPRPSSRFSRGRNSVKKLIDTFSKGREQYEETRVLGPLKGVRKCGVPVMPGLGNIEAVLSTGITSCRDESTLNDKTDDLDLDSLPPPPLEVLNDNSFEGAHRFASSDNGSTKKCNSPVAKRAIVSRLRASVQSVTVLPCKGNLPQLSRVPLVMRPDTHDTVTKMEPEKAVATSTQKQAKKITHLQESSETHSEVSSITNCHSGPFLSNAAASLGEQNYKRQPDPEFKSVPQTIVSNSQPSVTTPLSRVRMLPSTPSVPSTVQQRLTSPCSSRKQPIPASSSSPPISRKLPTPPPVHRRLPSPPVTWRNVPNAASSFPFKAPSPPASPQVQRWSRASSSCSSNDSTSRLTGNACSVFGLASPSLFEAQPYSVPQPPQAWTSAGGSPHPRPWGSHARYPVALRGPQPFIRRCHSERRTSLPSRSAVSFSMAQSCGSEPSLNTQGLGDEAPREDELWRSQSDLRTTSRSLTHPDLCIVGQSLHRV